jgi:hypothetical protein
VVPQKDNLFEGNGRVGLGKVDLPKFLCNLDMRNQRKAEPDFPLLAILSF